MSTSFDELLAVTDDEALLSAVFKLIVRHYGDDLDVSQLRPEERNFFLAYQAPGIIGNGRFNYLFEGSFRGDPDFSLTAEAYRAIGCADAAEAFGQALALFPGGRAPTDVDKRLKIYRKGGGDKRHEIDCRFWDASDDIDRCLVSYVRSHREVFERLEKAPPAKRAKQKPVGPKREERERNVGDVLAELPHWARVAFAARCARRVLPLFSENWPNAKPERGQAVLTAIRLAEESAEAGRALDGLKEAEINAVATAGAASMGLYGCPDGMEREPLPEDGNRAIVAANVARVAQNAARTARSYSGESAEAALEAFGFARSAASDGEELLDRILDDLSRLHRAARDAGWWHRTPVPTNIWDTI
jgi:hypothetical protein